MPDLIFEHPRLAQVYDALDEPERRDLALYEGLVAELGAASVLDIGCGTGTLACRLAQRGVEVVGVDPARASLDMAVSKPGADRVRWVLGDAATLPALEVDLATMTGNVAQVFITDSDWMLALRSIRAALRPGGCLAFETRDPAKQAWLSWTREQTYRRLELGTIGTLQTWSELVRVSGEVVTFRTHFVFDRDGTRLTSESTLRFRNRNEIAESLASTGLRLDGIRDAADRPGLELVFLACR